MAGYSAMLKELFPKAATLFAAAEDNSRSRCDNALAFMKLSAPEKAAAVHIAAESGAYEAADFLLQAFARDKGPVKLLSATYDISRHDPVLSNIVNRYGDSIHDNVTAKIEAVHKLAVT